ncbi:response regulator [Urbifossiella limnaea]|uniref:KDP operon transcriptional regulatory protein KdpE n=1 Tax=Urbifossiella limnaea TaxID=2528023 RepID=A0A517XY08_9BACT|nr:response regulator [Urbifossiella limnaea]QDU22383.1 KDP operon transcriptional regulatory protein KdpE [Urbifossiella limnaea]
MRTNDPLVLVIEDETPIRRFLRASLTEQGYRVEEATSGEEGIKKAAAQPPDLVILDLGLPGLDGQDVLRQLREWLTAPVIVLSARDQEQQKVEALDAGADDYLAKPFGMGELLARMRTALRHARPQTAEGTVLQVGDLRIDLAARTTTLKDESVHLTPLEYKLLVLLVRNAGKVLTHRQLLRDVWGPHDVHESHYLRVFVATLRRKVEPDPTQPRYILTEQGVGYRFAAE